MTLDSEHLLTVINKPMPFGKYQGRPLLTLPLAYLCWFERQGWPLGSLGAELALIYELKHNGLDQPLYDLLSAKFDGK